MNIEIYDSKKPLANDLIRLYLDAGWGTEKNYENSENIFNHAIKNSNLITAYDGNKLVGFIRFLSDYSHDTQILEFIVDKKYRNNGIGTKLIEKLAENFGNTSIYINSTEIAVDFLSRRHFKKHKLTGMSYRQNLDK